MGSSSESTQHPALGHLQCHVRGQRWHWGASCIPLPPPLSCSLNSALDQFHQLLTLPLSPTMSTGMLYLAEDVDEVPAVEGELVGVLAAAVP